MATGSFSAAATDLGSAITNFGAAQASSAAAGSYDAAIAYAQQNIILTQESTQIKEQQQQRLNYLTTGTQETQIAGAGFAKSGSALDIIRSSASQGAMTKAILANQGAITELGYQQQITQYGAMKAAASSAANTENLAGDISTVAAIVQVAAML